MRCFACRGAIRLGEHNIRTDPDCEDGVCADPYYDYYPKEVVIHKDYGNPRLKNDIALIRLDRRVVLSSKIQLDMAQSCVVCGCVHCSVMPLISRFCACRLHNSYLYDTRHVDEQELREWNQRSGWMGNLWHRYGTSLQGSAKITLPSGFLESWKSLSWPKIMILCGTRRFSAIFTMSRHWTLSWAMQIH